MMMMMPCHALERSSGHLLLAVTSLLFPHPPTSLSSRIDIIHVDFGAQVQVAAVSDNKIRRRHDFMMTTDCVSSLYIISYHIIS